MVWLTLVATFKHPFIGVESENMLIKGVVHDVKFGMLQSWTSSLLPGKRHFRKQDLQAQNYWPRKQGYMF